MEWAEWAERGSVCDEKKNAMEKEEDYGAGKASRP